MGNERGPHLTEGSFNRSSIIILSTQIGTNGDDGACGGGGEDGGIGGASLTNEMPTGLEDINGTLELSEKLIAYSYTLGK